MDLHDDPFADTSFGRLALKKIKPTSSNFRLFEAGWLETGGPPETWEIFEVIGAEFREAKRGPNKGKLSIMVPNTRCIVHLHRDELRDDSRSIDVP
ncbi:hypothetical protein [Burkholderia glumae]|uniref:hypothetical protein n=1 Tax=Burkholderia glumae TaxID=337 RepID=UPI0021518CFC|nr:hypothetical protein [Burkholderia glumae]UVT00047.1 hypothetical protein EFP19_30825 [Burkholderia glumae]